MNPFDLYRSLAVLTCYDDSGDELTEAELAEVDAAVKAGDIKMPADFTPEQQKVFNQAMALTKRKGEQKLKDALVKQEKQYKDMLTNNSNLTTKERAEIQDQLSTVQGQLRTEKAQSQMALKELEEAFSGKLTAAEKRANEAESRYRDSTIKRSLQDAAVKHDAYRPEQVVKLMADWTKLVDDKVVVDFPDDDPTTGEPIMTTRTPEDAVKRMTEKPDVYGNLFRNNIVSGIGSNSATGGAMPGSGGKIDVRKLTQQQYRDLRKTNPESVGLNRTR